MGARNRTLRKAKNDKIPTAAGFESQRGFAQTATASTSPGPIRIKTPETGYIQGKCRLTL